jgi:hypothetical protein
MHTAGKLLVELPSDITPATAEVALGVNVAQAEAFIVGRLAQRGKSAEQPITSPAS